MDLQILELIAKTGAQYGVLTFGWIFWLLERRKSADMTQQLIAFLAKQEIVKERENVQSDGNKDGQAA